MSKYNEILGSISRIGQTATQAGSAVSTLFSNDSESASTIRDTYLNGFFGETTAFSPNVFSRLFDEPTYLTFRLQFNFDNNAFENRTNLTMGGLTGTIGTLDVLPEPLLSIVDNNITSRISTYSTYNYLKNALGESQRAKMLKLFVNGLKDIQDNYPYYFKGVSGLGDLMKTTPTDGIRLKDGENVITIKCLEGLDLKITQLMQLYKNVAWDEYYQRWILADMMRYFNLKIYVSEIRLFHSSNISASKYKSGIIFPFGSSDKVMNANSIDKLYDSSLLSSINGLMNIGSSISSRLFGTNSATTKTLNTINQTIDTITGLDSGVSGAMYHLCNNAINDVMPTICFDCHMCEFDIEDTFNHINDLHSSNKESTSPEPEIKIKVGKLFVKQIYPLNSQLQAGPNGYSMVIKDANAKDKDYIKGSYIDDEILMEANYYKNEDSANDIHTNELNNAFNKDAIISKLSTRMNDKLDNSENFSYRPTKGGQELAALALTEGILNQTIKSTVKSTATEDESLKRNIRETSISNETPRMQQRVRNVVQSSTEENVNSALNAIRSLRDSVYNNDEISSAATNSYERMQLQENVMRNVLENISRSTATDETRVLKDLVDIILDENRSTATSRKIASFNELN